MGEKTRGDIAVIGITLNPAALPALFSAIHRRGYSNTLVCPRAPSPAYRNQWSDNIAAADRSIAVSFADADEVDSTLEELHRLRPFAGCVAVGELYVAHAARIREKLGLPGTPLDAVKATVDKPYMRRVLNDLGISPVPATLVGSPSEAWTFAETNGLPIILKPKSGTGSLGVFKISAREDLDTLPEDYFSGPIIAEDFLDGPEFSVETFADAGQHHLIAITEKALAGDQWEGAFVEMGHCVPARTNEQDVIAIRDMVAQALTALGITHGCAHTEVKLTRNGPRIIETHNRAGGDFIPRLAAMTTGVDLFELMVAQIDGEKIDLPAVPAYRSAAAIRFFQGMPGRFRALENTETVIALPYVHDLSVYVSPREVISPARSSIDRIGHLIALGETSDEAVANANEAAAMLRLVVD